MSELEEVAKAAAETAKFGTKALDVSEKMTGFLAKVFKEPAEQAAGIISDKLKFMRWQRQVRIVDEVQKILADRNVTETKAIPPKFAIPLLEGGSVEENDELQDLWINLIANSMDNNFKEEIRYSYIDILKKLTSTDVKLLDRFYRSVNNAQGINDKNLGNFIVKKEELIRVMNISEEEYYMSIYNLFGAQCLAAGVVKGGLSFGDYPATSYLGTEQVVMTVFGYKLVEAAIL